MAKTESEYEQKQWAALLSESHKALLEYFKTGALDPDAHSRARIATSVLSSVTKHEQTQSAREATAVLVARELANNKEEFAQYLKVSTPRLAIKAAS